MILKELASLEDIKLLVNNFYQKVLCDETLGPIFEHYDLDWSKHLNTMYDFWSSVILTAGTYKGNPLKTHMEVHNETPLHKEDFDLWLNLFIETVDEHFQGEKAILIKQRAAMSAKTFYNRISS